ncbi:hypothetical protein M433DRAFT_488646 [Acidomyces richmondensis BFW]|nr:MAG: hypothetical protein FE78DRAFT_443588 [Acidomyces sp. 'richmondensis']KYG41284.1 hypothetical protein M433DRAFT_488646 [Acidomyces richmondensis BFW]
MHREPLRRRRRGDNFLPSRVFPSHHSAHLHHRSFARSGLLIAGASVSPIYLYEQRALASLLLLRTAARQGSSLDDNYIFGTRARPSTDTERRRLRRRLRVSWALMCGTPAQQLSWRRPGGGGSSSSSSRRTGSPSDIVWFFSFLSCLCVCQSHSLCAHEKNSPSLQS